MGFVSGKVLVVFERSFMTEYSKADLDRFNDWCSAKDNVQFRKVLPEMRYMSVGLF